MTVGVQLAANGTSWSSISDRRAKEDISDLAYGLDVVRALRPTSYRYKGNSNTSIGFIAQEVLKLVPEVVDVPQNPDEMMSIRYQELVPVLTKGMQELADENEALKAELAKQREAINELYQLLDSAKK